MYLFKLQDHPDSINLICNELIKGGSMGQGTTVPGNFDVDLVIYSESENKYLHLIFILYTVYKNNLKL